MEPLARKGARLPTPKLRQYFRGRGLWALPSFDPAKASAQERRLLSPTGPAGLPEVNGPAGRAVWVEAASGPAPTAAAGASGAPVPSVTARVCQAATARCGLTCTQAPALASPGARPATGPSRAELRRLRRLLADHALVLTADPAASRVGIYTPAPHATDLAAYAGRSATPSVPTADSLRPQVLAASAALPAKSAEPLPQPLYRLTLGLRLPAPSAPVAAAPLASLAETLCRLADRLPDDVQQAWTGNDTVREARALALGRWLGLRFVERPVAAGRPLLEHRYIRVHYRDRVFTIRRRPGDGAHLIRPLMVVVHYTGSTSLSSALYTLRAQRLGARSALQQAGSLAVGVPYVVDRDGTIYRLFRDDARFGRHTIGLNHSAMGIENVGNRHHPLTARQIEVNARLVEYAALRYPLRWLIGHREVYQMAHTPLYLEAIPGYCSSKADPTWRSLRALRARLAHLRLEGPPRTRPVLKHCREMFQYFKRQRQGAGHPPPRARAAGGPTPRRPAQRQ